MKTIISAGHICLDITPVFPDSGSYGSLGKLLVPGKLIEVGAADIHTGGSVANTGLALKILGNDVRLLGKVGDDAFGSIIRKILADYGAGGLITDPGSPTSYTVVLAVPGIDRIFLHDPGANDTFSGADIPDEALEDASLFHFGYPTLMKRMYEDSGRELTDLFRRVRSFGIATSLDLTAVDPATPAGQADWKSILAGVLPLTDFFVPSFEELCFMLDRERYDRLAQKGGDMAENLDIRADVVPLADELLAMGCRIVLIKCGTSGMYYRTAGEPELARVGSRLGLDTALWANREGIQPCFRADIVRSGAGAGDTSIAAFLTAVLAGRDPARCAAIAAAEGACCVTTYDALSGLRPIGELEARIDAGWETCLSAPRP